METTRPILALTLAALFIPLSACDADMPGASDADYRAVGHLDLAAVKRTSWLKDALGDDALELPGLDACGDVLRQAKAITFGAGEDAFEVYVRGPIDAAAANACGDQIDAEMSTKARGSASEPTPEATMLADDLFVVFAGDLTPSRSRLRSLLSVDPSPKGDQPIWMVATADGKDDPVSHVQAWADPSKGLDAHVEVQFDDAAKASEVYGQAMLGLAALRLSDEAGALASAVDLDSSGDTVTAELHATPTQLEALMKASTGKTKGKGKSGASIHAGAHAGPTPDGDGHSFRIQIGASE